MKALSSSEEAARLEALRQYAILDTAAEQAFDDLARLAAYVCKAPAALISFVDADRVWFKSKVGLSIAEHPRDEAFCAHAILQPDLFIVSDASRDEHCAVNPLLICQPDLKFYAGFPLITPEGHALGTLCVLDRVARKLNEGQREALRVLARQVMSQLERRRIVASLAAVSHELSRETVERQRAQAAARESEARFRRVADSDMMGIIFADLDGSITGANDAFFKLLGYTWDDLASGELCWREMTPPEQRHLDDQVVERIKAGDVCVPFEKEYVRKDGTRVPVLFGAASLAGSQTEFVCFILDHTELRRAEERIKHLAYHDALTDLPNQMLFKNRLKQSLALAQRNGQLMVIMFVNLDRFKTINDTLGYEVGDQLLQEVAGRLSTCVRESDTVARFGSDEYVILLTQISRPEDAVKIAQKIHESLGLPFNFDGQELFVTASIGISLYPYDGEDIISLLKSAGAALRRAKEQDGNNYEFYTAGRTTKALKQLVLENNLRRGLEGEELIVHYQPRVNINTGQVVGAEALVRWQHPVFGLLSPSEFIPMAEDTGLIAPIGEWTLRAACARNKSWSDSGLASLHISVNLSARQFQQANLVEMVARALEETELDPDRLELELTESSIMKNAEQAIKKLRQLKAMGVQISIDDFGTGYSSLNYLKRFPIDTLKIDKSFVRDLSTDPDDAAIVRAIIMLAHSLKLNVVAEGVETEEQLEFLRILKCDEMQGFLFSQALTVEEFEQLLSVRRHPAPDGATSPTRPPLPSPPSRVRA